MVLLIINKENGEWKEITQEEKKDLSEEEKEKVLYIDGKLKKKLDFGLKQQAEDNDVVAIICGDEGSGKSNLAGNCMRYITKDKFNPMNDLIGSDYEDALNKISKVKMKGSLMFDEGNVFFLSTEVMKKENRELHKIFSIFRQKNLFVFIVLPSFFRLNSYFALDRSRFLLRTYLKKGKRSYFAYHGNKNKEKLYKYGKKDKDYHVERPNFRGRFEKCSPLESEDYKKFKLKTLEQSIGGAKKPKKICRKDIEKQKIRDIIKLNMDMSTNKLGKIIGLDGSRIRQIKIKMRDEEINA